MQIKLKGQEGAISRFKSSQKFLITEELNRNERISMTADLISSQTTNCGEGEVSWYWICGFLKESFNGHKRLAALSNLSLVKYRRNLVIVPERKNKVISVIKNLSTFLE